MGVKIMQDACKRLWAAVLEQAMTDIQEDHDSHGEEARKWLQSENPGTASFLWVCDVLDLDPALVRTACRYDWNHQENRRAVA